MSADKPLQIAILKTLAYADIFNQSLSTDELTRYLIGYRVKNAGELNPQDVSTALLQDGNWVLNGRERLLQLKQDQTQSTQSKLLQAKKYRKIFSLIPWIKAVGITGSVAAGTPTPTDDIDLLIITSPKRMWLSRLLLTAILNLINKRRKPNAKPNQINNKFCLNMWLSQDNLTEANQDLYAANELARIIPILNRNQTYQQYIMSNSWLQPILPNFYQSIEAGSELSRIPHSTFRILNSLDQLAEKLQRKVMKKPTRETVETNRLAFHPRDYHQEIMGRYRQRLQQLGLSE